MLRKNENNRQKRKNRSGKSVQKDRSAFSLYAKDGNLYQTLFQVIKDKGILDQALTHKSYANERRCKSNERLEFLGDAVLELGISDMLFKHFGDFDEGKMSIMRARLVGEDALYKIACKVGLPNLIKLGKSEAANGGKEKKSIVADCFEAVVGAIYLSIGFDGTKKILYEIFRPLADSVMVLKDPKTRLQELSQKIWKSVPEYRVVDVKGPEHGPIYTVSVKVGNQYGEASGESIKKSEENAAKLLLARLKK